MDAFAANVLSRLPLAEAVMRCWQWVMAPQALQEIFERFRGRSSEGVLTFEIIVNFMASALVEHRGSGNQAFTRAAEADELNASQEAVYGKRRRIPLSLSDGFLRAGTQRIAERAVKPFAIGRKNGSSSATTIAADAWPSCRVSPPPASSSTSTPGPGSKTLSPASPPSPATNSPRSCQPRPSHNALRRLGKNSPRVRRRADT